MTTQMRPSWLHSHHLNPPYAPLSRLYGYGVVALTIVMPVRWEDTLTATVLEQCGIDTPMLTLSPDLNL